MNIYQMRLLALADLLDTVDARRFNMKTFCRSGFTLVDPRNYDQEDCGTVACALGWSLAIPELFEVVMCETDITMVHDWETVSWVLFDVDVSANRNDWYFLFGTAWSSAAGTAADAAMRIRYYVKHGCPQAFTWTMSGDNLRRIMDQVRDDMA